MAAEKKLDYVILGLLSHEELTGYEIKKRMDTALKYFWGASYGSIYPTLGDIVARGLATKRQDTETGRNKIIYTITEAGRSCLREWLKLPVTRDEVRYETLLKLFFGSEAGPEQTIQHITAFEEKTRGELIELLRMEKVLEQIRDTEAAHQYYLLTVKFGIQTYQGYLRWCAEAREILETAEGM